VSVGGPGAVFWMWVTGFVGMALKLTEVTLAMLYRNVEDPTNPHGGAMWVVSRGLAKRGPFFAKVGKVVAVVFCLTLLISTFTGGNMFQAWNVADISFS
jgi:AGCS family alanine or glycine:cation symporter